MKLWRISNYADLKGLGGLRAGGRWHQKGSIVVYLAEHPAMAMLEILVHFDTTVDEFPKKFQLMEIAVDTTVTASRLSEKLLSDDWVSNIAITKNIGEQWLASQSSLLLRVPSAITPSSYNYLFNPRHTDADKASVISVKHYPFDPRLMK